MMIKKLVALFFACQLVASDRYAIVFVHLGNMLPGYLKEALHQARLFNPHAQLYLVTNKSTEQSDADKSIIANDKVTVVHCERLRMSEAHRQFLKKTTLDGKSKGGFWRKASERFFVLEEFILDYNLHDVFHLESDNMLYANLEAMMPVFKKYNSIAAVFDNDDRCIPSFLYIAHPQALSALNMFFAQQAHRGLNDMQIPALYKKSFGREAIDHLPLIPKEYGDYYPLRNALGNTVTNPTAYWYRIDEFASIFDGAALGQFLGGTDPSNGPQAPGKGFINESAIFDPSYFKYEWIVDESGRNVPHIIFKGSKYRINNLHIHSKALDQFKS